MLVVVGLIAIGASVYWFSGGRSEELALDFGPVVAGGLLLRGDLKAASGVRTSAILALAALPCVLVGFCLFQPLDLTRTEIRLYPGTSVAVVIALVCGVLITIWITRALGREAVQAAIDGAGVQQFSVVNAVALGIGIVVIGGLFIAIAHGDQSDRIAAFLAEQQTGPGYRYYLGSLSKVDDGQDKSVSGVVTAWRDNEIRTILLQWKER